MRYISGRWYRKVVEEMMRQMTHQDCVTVLRCCCGSHVCSLLGSHNRFLCSAIACLVSFCHRVGSSASVHHVLSGRNDPPMNGQSYQTDSRTVPGACKAGEPIGKSGVMICGRLANDGIWNDSAKPWRRHLSFYSVRFCTMLPSCRL